MQNITKEETRHDVSLREDDNSVGFEANSLSQLESARESQQAEPQKVLPLAEKLCLKTVPNECPQHPEEDLQFYCFNNNHVVCAECLVKGGYTGLEISNLKRAAEKLKGKFNELLEETTTKDEACYLVQKEIAGHETKLQEVFAGYEEEVRKEMENLRQAINRKEEEILQKISAVKEEKLKGLKDSCSKLHKFQEDIQKIKTALNDNTKGLNDANVCSYYSNISGVVKGYLNEDVNAEIEKTKRMFKYLSLQNHVQLGGFHDDAQRIEAQINNINTQVNKNKSSGSAYMIEKSEIVVKKIPLNNLLDTSVKDIKDNETTQRKRISREAFISQCLNQLQPNTESSGILGRIIQGERSPSPKESSRQPSTRSPLMSEIGKYDLNKSGYMKNLFSKYGNDTKRRQDSPSAKVDLRDFFNKKSKTSARDNTLSESIVLTTRRTPRQTLQDSFLLKASKLISPRKWPADCSTDRSEQLSVLKTVPDTYHSQERTSYLKKEAKRGDLLSKNDFKKLLSASKPQRQTVDKCALRESKLKEKLEKLSSKFFN